MAARPRGASMENLLLHGLQSRLGGIDLLLDLLEGLRLLQHLVPLTPHKSLLSVSDSGELGQEAWGWGLEAYVYGDRGWCRFAGG